jgi:hypothetical protein
MLQYIGDSQPVLRDELIYSTFYDWIEIKKHFTAVELRKMLGVLIDEEHLFYRIGSSEDPSVFTRAFTVLVVALIVRRHRQQPFLEPKEFFGLKHALLRYYREEKDLRGYLLEGGWAHSAAHGADALVELVQCQEADGEVQHDVLDAIYGMLYNGKHIFNEEEDERIATIVDVMINNNLLPLQELTIWISTLAECTYWPKSRQQVIARVNSKNFLRSLYFRRGTGRYNETFSATLLGVEVKLNKFHH